jgi:hypothetical protein
MVAAIAETVVIHSADPATTVIAALGLVCALASLAWQAWTFSRSGSRVVVEIRSGLMGPSGFVTAPGTTARNQLEQLRAQGFTTPIVAVRVSNIGRGTTSITSVGILYKGGAVFENAAWGPDLPLRLEGEHEETWHFQGQQVTGYAEALARTLISANPMRMRGQVRTAGRAKPISSKNLIHLREAVS